MTGQSGTCVATLAQNVKEGSKEGSVISVKSFYLTSQREPSAVIVLPIGCSLIHARREREPEHSRKSAIGAESAGMSRSFKHAYGTARKAGKCVKNVMRGIVSVTASDIK